MATGHPINTGEGAELGLSPTHDAVSQAFNIVSATVANTSILFPEQVNSPQLQQYFRTLVIRLIFKEPSIDLLQLSSLIQNAIQTVRDNVQMHGVHWLSSQVSDILED